MCGGRGDRVTGSREKMAEIGEILINLIWMFLKGEGFEGILEGYNTSPNPQFYFFKNKNSIVIIGEGI